MSITPDTTHHADPLHPPPRAQVLIVEDEPDHAEVMSEALRRPGHVCTIVGGGLELARTSQDDH
ncbi:MAG: hypothetical protein ACK462_06410, partial [Planctomyces sp.]